MRLKVHDTIQVTSVQTEPLRANDHITVDDAFGETLLKRHPHVFKKAAEEQADAADEADVGNHDDDTDAEWPPADEEIDAMGFEALGELLTSREVDPAPFNSKDKRRAALRELISKAAEEQA